LYLRLSSSFLGPCTFVASFACSHIANMPVTFQSAWCARLRHSEAYRSMREAGFPCDAPVWVRAWHVMTHLHLGLSSDPPIFVTQLAMLVGVVLAVVDVLRVWRPR
jgi:hypothetical protein